MSRLIWIFAVSKSLLLSPVAVKQLILYHKCPKFEASLLPVDDCKHCWMRMPNSVDPDLTPHSAAFDLGPHCLLQIGSPKF